METIVILDAFIDGSTKKNPHLMEILENCSKLMQHLFIIYKKLFICYIKTDIIFVI